jgi:hypothetical protein
MVATGGYPDLLQESRRPACSARTRPTANIIDSDMQRCYFLPSAPSMETSLAVKVVVLTDVVRSGLPIRSKGKEFNCMIRVIVFSLVCVSALLVGTEAATADVHCRPCPYSCYDLGLGRKECSEVNSARGTCCVDLTKKGMQVALEMERVEQQGGGDRPEYGRPQPMQERCPAGFQPSEQKCSPDERRRGCKDIRLPSGLGCVKR